MTERTDYEPHILALMRSFFLIASNGGIAVTSGNRRRSAQPLQKHRLLITKEEK
jgi:hypothetical protein